MINMKKVLIYDVEISELRKKLFSVLMNFSGFFFMDVVKVVRIIGQDDRKVEVFFSMLDDYKVMFVYIEIEFFDQIILIGFWVWFFFVIVDELGISGGGIDKLWWIIIYSFRRVDVIIYYFQKLLGLYIGDSYCFYIGNYWKNDFFVFWFSLMYIVV